MAVQVEIVTRNLELSERLQDYVTKKVGKLDRYLDTLEEARVDLRYDKSARNANDRQVAQLTVRGKGVLLRAEDRTDDIFASVDSVLDKVTRQIDRFKGKHWRTRGDGRSTVEAVMEVTEAAEEEAEPLDEIARRKRFSLLPMDEIEAVEQMKLLDHESFFIFLNVASGQVNVLYRRRDGSLGLIETQMG